MFARTVANEIVLRSARWSRLALQNFSFEMKNTEAVRKLRSSTKEIMVTTEVHALQYLVSYVTDMTYEHVGYEPLHSRMMSVCKSRRVTHEFPPRKTKEGGDFA